jgi:3-oxoacyl-[acyl-carrier protein] reductase
MNLNLQGRNALVCGSSKGIGKASAIEIARLGANVTLVARSANIMSELIKEMDTSQGQDHDFLQADFSDPKALKKAVSGLVSGKTIHILVNNTGGPPAGPLLEAGPEAFRDAYTKHLICNQLLAQLVTPGMKRAGYGRIINIISTSVKEPLDGLGVSNTTRGAVGNWAKTLANELGPTGITVNNVLPGMTDTGRLRSLLESRAEAAGEPVEETIARMQATIPLRRFAKPREIGAAVAFLATPAAAYITGTNVTVDGGRTRSL